MVPVHQLFSQNVQEVTEREKRFTKAEVLFPIDAFFDDKGHPIGLELIGTDTVQYADGRTANELVFGVVVVLDGLERLVPATLTGSIEALAGTALFSDYVITFDFAKEKITILH